MREIGEPIGAQRCRELVDLAARVYDAGEVKRAVKASEFAMEDVPDRVVVQEVEVRVDGERLRVARTRPDARPPFEWLLEVSSDLGETDYFKHYLFRDHDIVLAQRKVLTVIDEVEAEVLERDLRAALRELKG
ncbi:MAG TPA: hypothetical protein VMT30_07880 [Candidatus Saccharimonadia bacterium]|nr:hypothetical protein [Candidatus Saccharimonadia bacterium]